MRSLTEHFRSIKQYRFFLFILFSCSLLLPLIMAGYCPAKSNRKAEKQRIEQGIQKYRINIRKLQKGITGQQEQIQSTEVQKRNLLEELAQLDQQLQNQHDKLLKLEKQMGTQQEQINKQEHELQEAVIAKQNVQAHLQKRMKSYYKMGKVGAANVAFSTESLPLMLQFRESFSTLIEYDKALLEVYRGSINKLQQAKTALDLEKTILDDFLANAKKEEAVTNTIKLEKKNLLAQIQTQKELYEQAVGEMKKAREDLAKSLNKLKKKNKLFDQGFRMEKGKHPAPVPGEVIGLFGHKRKNRLGIDTKSTGITIATTGVHKVRAIFEGEVSYASYLYGYGNTVIIDHGFQYFSIVSRLEKLLTEKGKKVEQGDVIGLTGDTATVMDEGIYLEIRHGSKAQDPLKWIDKSELTLPQH